MTNFTDELLAIEAELHWKPKDPGDPQGGLSVLRKQFQDVLVLIHKKYPRIHSSYAAITGLKPGEYTPLAAINRFSKNPSYLVAESQHIDKIIGS